MFCALRGRLWLLLDGRRQRVCQTTPFVAWAPTQIRTVCRWWNRGRVTQPNAWRPSAAAASVPDRCFVLGSGSDLSADVLCRPWPPSSPSSPSAVTAAASARWADGQRGRQLHRGRHIQCRFLRAQPSCTVSAPQINSTTTTSTTTSTLQKEEKRTANR